MKKTLDPIAFSIIMAFILSVVALAFFVMGIREAVGQSEANPPDKQSVLITGTDGVPTSVTVMNEWAEDTVEMKATVPENICNYCIKNFNPSQCIEACGDILITD